MAFGAQPTTANQPSRSGGRQRAYLGDAVAEVLERERELEAAEAEAAPPPPRPRRRAHVEQGDGVAAADEVAHGPPQRGAGGVRVLYHHHHALALHPTNPFSCLQRRLKAPRRQPPPT